ncbi:MAG: hypothetical protein EBX03_04515, partial [Rhodobacteraceae bacterium]|nr:hypothetical protein [Paracoccaceae bacterium]
MCKNYLQFIMNNQTKKKDSIHLGQHWWFKNYFLTPTQGIWVGFKTLINIVKKTILIGSSDFSKSLQTPVKIELKEASEKLRPESFDLPSQPTGIALKGEFRSAFENRIPPIMLESPRTVGNSEMVVFSSGTLAENQVDKSNPLELGYDKWTNNFYDNKNFVQQSLHYL